MIKNFKEVLEASLFLSLTLMLYLFFALLLPLFPEPHGMIAMSEWAAFSKGGLIRTYLFLTSGVCVLVGAFLMSWAPALTHQATANLSITTYFFLWVDCVYALSEDSHSYKFLFAFVLGLVFLHFFFYLLGYFGFEGGKQQVPPSWKTQAVQYWLWGWMGFYFGLSGLLALHSFKTQGFHIQLALGSLLLCLLNHLLALFLRKDSGKDVDRPARFGRWVFSAGFLVLSAIWAIQVWVLE